MSVPIQTKTKLIRVKIVSPFADRWFLHQIPRDMRWGNCIFTLNRLEENYDWLVAYNNIPVCQINASKKSYQVIHCPSSNTILTTTEPASITHYSKAFTKQFGSVLTSQPFWSLPHSDRIYQQAGLIWLYGIGYKVDSQSFECMVNNLPVQKKHDLSMVFSDKKMRVSLHHKRFKFMSKMEQHFPEMHVYGRAKKHVSLDDKTDALALYRYSFALENHTAMHHWTEKLADAFLGLTLPFYAGCPNACDYFPEESFIPVDINKPEHAIETIKRAIRDGEYKKRLPYIIESRKRVLFEHNLFAVLCREIEKRHDSNKNVEKPLRTIYSRHAIRAQSPLNYASDFLLKTKAKLRHFEL